VLIKVVDAATEDACESSFLEEVLQGQAEIVRGESDVILCVGRLFHLKNVKT